jgi:hypothetical protein
MRCFAPGWHSNALVVIALGSLSSAKAPLLQQIVTELTKHHKPTKHHKLAKPPLQLQTVLQEAGVQA